MTFAEFTDLMKKFLRAEATFVRTRQRSDRLISRVHERDVVSAFMRIIANPPADLFDETPRPRP